MQEVLVIGGGLLGMLCARELALRGVRVHLIERGHTGRESSWAGGGILSPLYPWRYPDPVNVLSKWSQGHYPQLIEELNEATGIDPQHRSSGLLFLDALDEKDEAIAWAVRFGHEIELLRGSALHQCEPTLSPEHTEGLWMPEMGQVRNPRLLQAVRADLEARGVRITEGCEVTRLVYKAGQVNGVETTQGSLLAECVVLAAGSWSGQLLASVGLSLPVRPVKGQMLLFRADPDFMQRIVMHDYHYIIPRRDGRVLVGSTLEAEAGFDKQTSKQVADELKAIVRYMVPGLLDYPLETHWAGLRPGSPEGIPFIGEHPEIAGFYINTGHFRNGVVMGYASARLLSDLVTGHEPCVDPEPYAVDSRRTQLH